MVDVVAERDARQDGGQALELVHVVALLGIGKLGVHAAQQPVGRELVDGDVVPVYGRLYVRVIQVVVVQVAGVCRPFLAVGEASEHVERLLVQEDGVLVALDVRE